MIRESSARVNKRTVRRALAGMYGEIYPGGCMARTFAKAFYKSKAWLNCREAYIKSQRGLCEECLKEGRLTPAEIVHHKVELTPENINDPNIALNFDNLEAVCHACHDKIHDRRKRRYHVDELGNVIPY